MALGTVIPAGGTANAEGELKNTNNQSFANARANTDGQISVTNPTGETAYFLQGNTDPNRKLGRHFLKGDFSTIPAGAIVSSVTFNFTARYDTTTALETIVLGTASQADNLVVGNWANFSTEYGRYQPSSASDALQTLSLNAAGVAAVQTRSIVKFALISKNDFDNVDPGAGTGNAGPIWSTPTSGTVSRRPYFEITYFSSSSGLTSKIW